ncbi:MAG: amino acid transporter permease [Rhodoferax sp.]|nr:amino acid transporter permease [Rhodoferax sp.]
MPTSPFPVAPRPSSLAARARAALFPGPVGSAISLLGLLLLAFAAYGVGQWALVHAVFRPDFDACRAAQGQGACWGFVAEKYRLILFGRYPYEAQWRPLLATLLVLAMVGLTAWPRLWTRRGAWGLSLGWLAGLAAFFMLLGGGVAGLSVVEPERWGGLPLTVILTVIGMTACVPVGILLALGRRSTMPAVRGFCVLYIELVRGVPLITVLFFATFVLPLLLPPGWRLDAFTRIALGITLFQAAYVAETVRGGLQTVPRGQFQAAASLGLGYWAVHRLIVLPQAMVAVVPAFVNSLLSTFMDTSLVTVVSMYDLTGSLKLALGDPQWRIFFVEGYLFVAAIYFGGCLLLASYSSWLERRLSISHR